VKTPEIQRIQNKLGMQWAMVVARRDLVLLARDTLFELEEGTAGPIDDFYGRAIDRLEMTRRPEHQRLYKQFHEGSMDRVGAQVGTLLEGIEKEIIQDVLGVDLTKREVYSLAQWLFGR